MLDTYPDTTRDSEAADVDRPADWAVDLGARIVQARRRARLTQKALAEAAGISQVWLSKIERGLVSKYPFDTLAKLAPQVGEFGSPSPHPDDSRAVQRAKRTFSFYERGQREPGPERVEALKALLAEAVARARSNHTSPRWAFDEEDWVP